MPRESFGYRENLADLTERGVPRLMTQKQACEVLNIGRPFLKGLVQSGKIKLVGTLVPIGAVAKIMCG